MATRILLAGGERLLNEGLRQILEIREGFAVVGQAGDGVEAVRLAAELQPDIAVLELLLPRLSGIEAIRQIRSASRRIRCIVLSSQNSRSHVRAALRSGAAGYIVKNATASELVEAIEAARLGRCYLSPDIVEHVIDALNDPADGEESELGLLTGREREVLQLVAEGFSNKEIAAHLHVSTKTVDTHRANLMGKLDVHKTSSLVRFAIREGLIVP